MNVVLIFHPATRLNTQNPYETQIRNKFRETIFNMNIGISNWHI